MAFSRPIPYVASVTNATLSFRIFIVSSIWLPGSIKYRRIAPSTNCLLMSTEIKTSPARGRPRCFDLEQALDRSMALFWEKGFQNTSLDEIAQAVGVKKPSLYAAFGYKELLFRKVIQRD